MKKHTSLIITACLGLCFALHAWAGNTAGDTRFMQHNYSSAIEAYKKSIGEKDSAQNCSERAAYAKFKIGECHSYLNQPQEAVQYINDAIISGYQKAEAY